MGYFWLRSGQFSSIAAIFLLAGLFCFGAPTQSKNVLIIHSGGDDLLIYRRATLHFEQILETNSSLRVSFFHEYLNNVKLPVNSAQLAESVREQYFSGGGVPDLIVAAGTSALRLCIQYDESHFRAVPVVFLLADDRFVSLQHLPPQITGVSMAVDFEGTVRLALRLQPTARRIFFVVGTSEEERAYEKLFQREAGPLLSKYDVTFLDDLTLGELLKRLARLPRHSIVLYFTMLKDSTSTYYVPSQIVGSIVAASSAPVYGWFIGGMGAGIVGGSFIDSDHEAEQAARMAERILSGEPVRSVPLQRGRFQNVVDWRQLRRWHIGTEALPPGTVVLFREPSVWMKFRWIIAGALGIFALELLLILWLIRESWRRKLSEAALKALSGHLLNAQEDERARLARELHDGLNQQIAFLAISLDALQTRIPTEDPAFRAELSTQQNLLNELSKEVRRLSHDLHPPILKVFGIDRALRQYCEEFGTSYGMNVQLTSDIGPVRLPQEVELCFYRIAQESLRNVVKHANTDTARVSLAKNGIEYALSVADQGRGFNPADPHDRGLGLLSMQERVEALKGTLTVWSKANHGTVITARLPVNRKSPFTAERLPSDRPAKAASATGR